MERLERNTDPKGERLDTSALAQQERWNRFEKYVTLALKRKDERLTPVEFMELSALELEQIADQIPPIENVFDADAELKRIRTLPRGEKSGAIEVFKDMLNRQRESIMECRLAIERQIEWDPDVAPQNLARTVDFFADNWGFTEKMRDTARGVVFEYVAARNDVVALRQQFPDNAQLVSKLTGLRSEDSGAFDIEVGPISIDIATDSIQAKRMYPEMITQEQSGNKIGGYMGHGAGGTLYTVTITDAPSDPANTLTHEREHAKNAILMDFFDTKMKGNGLLTSLRIQGETDPVIRKDLIVCLARNHRDEALNRAKNEIIAMIKDGKSKYFDRFYKHDGNSYDFLKGFRDIYALSTDPAYQQVGTEIFVREYENILDNGFSAIATLSEAGYGINETIALFTDIDIQHWPAMARRMTASAR
ncbi:MAG: hypothetical protein Q7R90_01205 [bacterium]|nr:hypothetical protein [bacterium]